MQVMGRRHQFAGKGGNPALLIARGLRFDRPTGGIKQFGLRAPARLKRRIEPYRTCKGGDGLFGPTRRARKVARFLPSPAVFGHQRMEACQHRVGFGQPIEIAVRHGGNVQRLSVFGIFREDGVGHFQATVEIAGLHRVLRALQRLFALVHPSPRTNDDGGGKPMKGPPPPPNWLSAPISR